MTACAPSPRQLFFTINVITKTSFSATAKPWSIAPEEPQSFRAKRGRATAPTTAKWLQLHVLSSSGNVEGNGDIRPALGAAPTMSAQLQEPKAHNPPAISDAGVTCLSFLRRVLHWLR